MPSASAAASHGWSPGISSGVRSGNIHYQAPNAVKENMRLAFSRIFLHHRLFRFPPQIRSAFSSDLLASFGLGARFTVVIAQLNICMSCMGRETGARGCFKYILVRQETAWLDPTWFFRKRVYPHGTNMPQARSPVWEGFANSRRRGVSTPSSSPTDSFGMGVEGEYGTPSPRSPKRSSQTPPKPLSIPHKPVPQFTYSSRCDGPTVHNLSLLRALVPRAFPMAEEHSCE